MGYSQCLWSLSFTAILVTGNAEYSVNVRLMKPLRPEQVTAMTKGAIGNQGLQTEVKCEIFKEKGSRNLHGKFQKKSWGKGQLQPDGQFLICF